MFLPCSIFSCLLSYHFNDALTNIYFLSSSSSFFINIFEKKNSWLDQTGEGGETMGWNFSSPTYLDLSLLSPDYLQERLLLSPKSKTKRLPDAPSTDLSPSPFLLTIQLLDTQSKVPIGNHLVRYSLLHDQTTTSASATATRLLNSFSFP